MINTMIAILNKDFDISKQYTNLDYNNLFICSNIKYDTTVFKNDHYIDFVDGNIAKCKNNIIRKAKELKYDYVVIIEDDIEVKDTSIIDMYITYLKVLNCGIMMYGFGGKMNKALSQPNPAIRFKVKDNYYIFNRYICSSFICIDLSKDILFNEDLLVYEMDYLMHKLIEDKIYPFDFGFFIDVYESWNYLNKVNKTTRRNHKDIKHDSEFFTKNNIKFNVSNNADNVTKTLIDILKKVKDDEITI